MRLARFRRLAWVLALVLLAGPAMPAFASMPGAGYQGVLAGELDPPRPVLVR